MRNRFVVGVVCALCIWSGPSLADWVLRAPQTVLTSATGLSTGDNYSYDTTQRCEIVDSTVYCTLGTDMLSPRANIPTLSPNLGCTKAPAWPGAVTAGTATPVTLRVLCPASVGTIQFSSTAASGTQTGAFVAQVLASVTIAAGAAVTHSMTVCKTSAPSVCDTFQWVIVAQGSSQVPEPTPIGCRVFVDTSLPSVGASVGVIVLGCANVATASYEWKLNGVPIAGGQSQSGNVVPIATPTTTPTALSLSVCNSSGCQTPEPTVLFAPTAQSPLTGSCDLDIDGDGVIAAVTDGVLLTRSLLGFSGNAVVDGAVGPNATRSTWTDIRSYLNTRCGLGLQQ